MCPFPVQEILIHLQGEQTMFRNVWWIFSGQQQLQTVTLQTTSARNWIGADTASKARNIVAGMHTAAEAGTHRIRMQHPCSGSSSIFSASSSVVGFGLEAILAKTQDQLERSVAYSSYKRLRSNLLFDSHSARHFRGRSWLNPLARGVGELWCCWQKIVLHLSIQKRCLCPQFVRIRD